VTARQLPLRIPPRESYAETDFIERSANESARTWLARTEAWPEGRLALWGAADHGKTHLLRMWAFRVGADVLAGLGLVGFPVASLARGLAVDDADRADEAALLHVLNAARELGQPVLLASRAAPARWPVALPDLASRLRAITAVEIGPPDDELLRGLLLRWLAARQLVASEALHGRLLLHLPRRPEVLRAAVELLDQQALASRKREVTAAMLRAALDAVASEDR
jgi:chromosomal replication initiation ATPase DnaA